MTTEDRKRQLFAQPSAAKEVYRPDGHYLNGHIILRGPHAVSAADAFLTRDRGFFTTCFPELKGPGAP